MTDRFARWIQPALWTLALMCFLAPLPSLAAGADSSVCTTFQERANAIASQDVSNGMIGDIYTYLVTIVGSASEKLFTSFTQNAAYHNAVIASFTLMILFFGIAFTMGLVQASFSEMLTRLLKLGVVWTVISPSGWEFFNSTVVYFFNQGTNDLILGVIAIGTGLPNPPNATPFYQLDIVAKFMIHPETLIAIMTGTLKGGPFGIVMSALMGFSMVTFVGLIIDALRMYAVTFVARAMLLGIAPIFIVFLLFQKTAPLFKAWVNALVATALQPILMFTFLSFFLTMITTASTEMMGTKICWTKNAQTIKGSTDQPSFWTFIDPETNEAITSDQTWKGSLQCLLQRRGECPEFPINIINILTFLILVYIAKEFSKIVEQIANELSSAQLHVGSGGQFESMMSQVKGKPIITAPHK